MSLTVTTELLQATSGAAFKEARGHAKSSKVDREYTLNSAQLDTEALEELIAVAKKLKDTKTARAGDAILVARSGRFSAPVPNFKAFQDVLESFLKADLIDGWIYVTGDDGKLYPELVTAVTFDDGKHYRGTPHPNVRIHTASYGRASEDRGAHRLCSRTETHQFSPGDVANRRIADILAARGMFKETPALRAAYAASMERHNGRIQSAFAHQFRLNGAAYRYEADGYARRGAVFSNRKVIHDLMAIDYGPFTPHAESVLFEADAQQTGVGAVPEHPVIRVFDLKTHEYFWVHSDQLTPYEYNRSLREKLVLPASHRDLLDVLTSDLDAFVSDIIEGKSAGNVILCKGIAGVGKTLTAEVYAELIERPLYSIHSGILGTSAEQVDKNLQEIFLRAKRWDCVLLLDEADVFVVRRGDNIEQNAIVAEFLRTLEYFEGLLFMTTNRPDDIDEAIISRCAAIISYGLPEASDAASIWRVMARQYSVSLAEPLIAQLVTLFPRIAPRDIKMLLRLALRVAKGQDKPLSLDVFRRCAMFRAIEIATPA